jgi:hypothetical protein
VRNKLRGTCNRVRCVIPAYTRRRSRPAAGKAAGKGEREGDKRRVGRSRGKKRNGMERKAKDINNKRASMESACISASSNRLFLIVYGKRLGVSKMTSRV